MLKAKLYLHQVPKLYQEQDQDIKNLSKYEGSFIFLEYKTFDIKHLQNRLQKLSTNIAKSPISPLDFWFTSQYTFIIKFGNTMPKKYWQFWDNTFCQFPGMKGCPITFNNAQLKKRGSFNPKDISRASVNNRRLTFKYTGEDGGKDDILNCKFELYIKNIYRHNGKDFETKIILDPEGKNNGVGAPLGPPGNLVP